MRISLKKLLALTLALCLAFSLTACGSPSSSAVSTAVSSQEIEEANEPVTINFWYGYAGAVDAVNLQLVEQFNETVGKEKNITVVATAQETVLETANQLSTALQAGTQPAVLVLDTTYQQKFINDNALEPLTAFVENDNYDLTDFYEGIMVDSYSNDTLYSLPYLRSTPVLYVNKGMLTQAGLTEEDLSTWDGFFEACETIHSETGALGTMSFTWNWLFNSMLLSYGTSIFNDDLTQTNINSDISKDVISQYAELRDNGAASLIVSEGHLNTMVGGFTQSLFGMFFYSSGGLTTLQSYADAASIELSVLPMPAGTEKAVVTGGGNLVMPVGLTDREKQAGWEFIKYLTSAEATITTSVSTGYLPTRQSVGTSSTMVEFYDANPMFKIAAEQLQYAAGKTVPENEASRKVIEVLDNIWVGSGDIDSLLASAETEINALLTQ